MSYRNRHECKFLVPESTAAVVLRRVLPHVEPDPFARASADHSYPIASLYLDDQVQSLYRETVEGQSQRFKLRVRTYDDDPAAPVFLEIKRRHDKIVQKMRCPLGRHLLAAVLAGEAVELTGAHPGRQAALVEFQRLMQLRHAAPVVVVRYQRTAYIGLDDHEVRVTFDRRLSVLPETEPRVRIHDPAFRTVHTGGVVLEMKFTDRCPPWMLETMRICDLRRRSFSKYCNSVDALGSRRTAAT
ncbi:MAG: polyphosphate polymerase domain-containing protein [Planctomycetota bacterium]